MAAQLAKLPLMIPAGQSLSNAFAPGNGFVVGLVMPPAWTAARLTVQVSVDGTRFHDLYTFEDPTGTTPVEFKVNVVPAAIVAIDPERMLMAQSFKLRSGTSDNPVPQAAARAFTVVTVSKLAVTFDVADASAAGPT